MNEASYKSRALALVHEVVERYGVLIAPDLLPLLLEMERDPVDAVGEILEHLPTLPPVLTNDSIWRLR